MTSIFHKLFTIAPVGLGSLLAVAAAPSTASAHGVHVDFRIGFPPVVVTQSDPVYVDREVRVWVEPVYHTVCDRVWVPDQYEYREVVYGRHHWHEVAQERVLVAPGHYEDVNRQVVVTPGHFETHIERVCVSR